MQPPQTRSHLPYLPALDGLRALAVAGVLIYHADLHVLPGGFLGVEVFFVLSGYLITSLLLAEWRERDAIDLKRFWLRRARRLLPAVLVLIVATLAVSVLFLPDEVASLRQDALASTGYITNWYLIFDQKSYFETVGRPSLLQHLWSLAVEEQFYLIWPVVLAVLLRRCRRRWVLLLVVAGAAASAGLMALLYSPDVDPSRVYYGTDTRASGLLVGAALAFVWVPDRPLRFVRRLPAIAFDLVGVVALGALVGFGLQIGEYQPSLYLGGFGLVALVTAVAIAAATHPRARLMPRVLALDALVWAGTRSYGIYLYHWPVFTLTRPDLDVPIDGPGLFVGRLLATLLLAEVSYRVVEVPIRHGALERGWRALAESRGRRRLWLTLRWTGATAALGALAVSVACARTPAPPTYLARQATDTALAAATAAPTPTATAVPVALPASPTTGVPASATARPSEPSAPTPTATPVLPSVSPAATSAITSVATSRSATVSASRTPTTPPAAPRASPRPEPTAAPSRSPSPTGHVFAVGNSVMLGAEAELEAALGNVTVNAAVGRQASTTIDILKHLHAAGQLGNVVVVQVGNNGPITSQQFDELMAPIAGVKRVVVINLREPRSWQDSNNAVLADGVRRHPNAVLVDWYSISAHHPEYFWGDGVHLRPAGARAYAAAVAAAVRSP